MHSAPPPSELPTQRPPLSPDVSLLLEVTHLAARATERNALFSRSCELSVERLGLRFAWVGWLHDDARVDPVARAGDDGGYIDSIEANALLRSEHGRGPAGETMRSGQLSVSNDFLSDPRTAPWHDAAARAGVGGALSLPIRQDGRVVAALVLYAPTPDFFDEALVVLGRRLADELSFGLDTVQRHEERRRIQHELEKSAQRWRFALEGPEHGVWEWDATTNKVFLSRAWKSMLGYADAEIGDSLSEWQSRVHPDDLAPAMHALARHIEGLDPIYRNEHRLRCKDGSYKWILDQGKVLHRDEHGLPVLVIGTHTDIDAQKRAEVHLRGLEERMRLALEAGQQGLFDLDLRTGEATVSPEYATRLGYDPATFRETNAAWLERLHPDDKSHCAKAFTDYIEGRRSEYRIEFRQRTASGGWRWILSVGRVVERDAEGRPVRMLGTHTDIDALKRLESTLKKAEAIAHLGAFEWDVASSRQWWSEEVFRIFGRPPRPDAPVFEDGLSYVHPDDRARLEAALADAVAGRSPTYATEFRAVHPDGAIRFVSARGEVERNVRSEPTRLVGTILDVTEQKERELGMLFEQRRAGALLELAALAPGLDLGALVKRTLALLEELTASTAVFVHFLTDEGRPDGSPVWSSRALDGKITPEELVRTVTDALAEARRTRIPAVAELPAAVPVGLTGFARTVLVPVAKGQHVHMVFGISGKPADYEPQDIETVRLLGDSLWNFVVRRRGEEALARSEARYRQLFEANPHPMWVFDLQTLHFLAVNDAAIAHYGWSRDEFLAMTIKDIRPPEELPRLLQVLSPEPDEMDRAGCWRHLKKDGTPIDVEISGHVIDFDGHRSEVILAHDVTDRLAADRARLEAERKADEYVVRLERASQATLGAISAMMDMRDAYTAGHERRVGELAAAIAAEMGLSDLVQEGLRFAGTVHDVGKIAVPAEILSKPTRLSKSEYELIKTHAQIGFDILKDVDFPWPVAQVALQHHERMDGSGYPQGLKGDEILLEARITAVADVVESMASHRPYRPSRGVGVALEEIEQNAGKIYDPVAAAACLRLFREKGYTLPS